MDVHRTQSLLNNVQKYSPKFKDDWVKIERAVVKITLFNKFERTFVSQYALSVSYRFWGAKKENVNFFFTSTQF